MRTLTNIIHWSPFTFYVQCCFFGKPCCIEFTGRLAVMFSDLIDVRYFMWNNKGTSSSLKKQWTKWPCFLGQAGQKQTTTCAHQFPWWGRWHPRHISIIKLLTEKINKACNPNLQTLPNVDLVNLTSGQQLEGVRHLDRHQIPYCC